MKTPCERFRERLADVLSARTNASTLDPLRFHEHLLACPSCRQILDEEQALEALLSTGPSVAWPADLAERLLVRLRSARADERLDALLGQWPPPVPPDGLATRILRGLREERSPVDGSAPRGARRRPVRWTLVAAAVIVAGLLGAWLPAGRDEAPPEELLASFEMLEWWDVLTRDDLEIVVTSLDTVDELLLELDPEGS